MTIRVGINGFGSIGRRFFRQTLGTDVELVAVNDLGDVETYAHLLKYDTNYGTFPHEVRVENGDLLAAGQRIKWHAEREPGAVPWGADGVDVVVECTGLFTDAHKAVAHIEQGGAKKVVISAPAKHEDITVVMGVNEDRYDPAQHRVISNASCTTNCLAPVVQVLDQNFGVERGLMTTVHAYTNDQRVLDLQHKDLRRARSAPNNIIPTSTGAAKAIGRVLPHLEGKLNGISMRVPTAVVSVVDLVAQTRDAADAEAANEAFRAAAEEGRLKGILGVEDAPLVSSDFRADTRSSIVDSPLTMAVGEHFLKVVAWYDNEWGYSARLVDLCAYLGKRGL